MEIVCTTTIKRAPIVSEGDILHKILADVSLEDAFSTVTRNYRSFGVKCGQSCSVPTKVLPTISGNREVSQFGLLIQIDRFKLGV